MHDFFCHEDWTDLLTNQSFTLEDARRMKSLANLVAEHTSETFALFLEEMKKVGEEKPIKENEFRKYMSTFWNAERNREYVSAIVDFFQMLLSYRYSPARLMAALNKIHLFWMRVVLSQLTFFSRKRSVLLETLQRAANFDKQILMEISLRNVIEVLSQGFAERVEKNSELHYTKEMLRIMEQQQERVQHAVAVGEQLTSSIHEVAQYAATVTNQTSEAVRMAESGKQVITLAMEEIVRSGGTFESIVHRFAELQRYLSNIENVVDLIHKISNQTHLLALNASIEAARSGEKGRGFSVVAQEIRKLAQSTKDAVQDIERNVEEVHSLTGDVADSIQTASKVIQKGIHEANEAFQFVTDLISRIVEINGIIRQITAVTMEQSAAAEKLSAQMCDISEELQNLSEIFNEAVTGSVEVTRGRALV